MKGIDPFYMPWLPFALSYRIGAYSFRVWCLLAYMDARLHRTGEALYFSSEWLAQQMGGCQRGVREARHDLARKGMIRLETTGEYYARKHRTPPGRWETGRGVWLVPPWDWMKTHLDEEPWITPHPGGPREQRGRASRRALTARTHTG
ncbi:MAG: hypothetical protein V4583_16280 [Pseudomonadota bacterium]